MSLTQTSCVGCGSAVTIDPAVDNGTLWRCGRCGRTALAQPVTRQQPCGAGVTPCGQPARLYPCGWRCEEHRP